MGYLGEKDELSSTEGICGVVCDGELNVGVWRAGRSCGPGNGENRDKCRLFTRERAVINWGWISPGGIVDG